MWITKRTGRSVQEGFAAFRSIPCFILFIAFAAGIAAGEGISIGIFPAAVFCLCGIAGLCLVRYASLGYWPVVMAVFLGLGVFHVQVFRELPAAHIDRLFFRIASQEVALIGEVFGDVKRHDSTPCWTTFFLSVRQVEDAFEKRWPAQGDIHVKIFRFVFVEPGMVLRVKGRLHRPYDFGSGRFSFRRYLHQRKVDLALSVKKDGAVDVVAGAEDNPDFFIRLRRSGKRIVQRYLSGIDLAVVNATLFGDWADIPKPFYGLFQRTGTAHVIAISGLHMSILIVLFFSILSLIPFNRSARYLAVVLLIGLYVPLTGSRASVLRAGIMAVVYLFSFILERTRSSVNILGLAGLLILLANPLDLFSVGFQLSFLAVFALIVLAPQFEDLFKPFFPPVLDSLRTAAAMSWAAWIGVLGCVAYYFEMVTPIGMIANLIVVPLTNILIGLSAILVLTGGWFPFCAVLISFNLQVILRLVVYFLYVLDRVPGGCVKVSSISLTMCVAYYVLLGGLILGIGRKRKRPSEIRRPLS